MPLSLWGLKFVGGKSRSRFVAQWRHAGALNAHVEGAFTGHAVMKVLGHQLGSEQHFDEVNERLHHASFGAQFISGTIQPMMMLLGNLNYVVIAVAGGLIFANGSMSIGGCRRLFSTRPIHPTADPDGVDVHPCASPEALRRSGSSSFSMLLKNPPIRRSASTLRALMVFRP